MINPRKVRKCLMLAKHSSNTVVCIYCRNIFFCTKQLLMCCYDVLVLFVSTGSPALPDSSYGSGCHRHWNGLLYHTKTLTISIYRSNNSQIASCLCNFSQCLCIKIVNSTCQQCKMSPTHPHGLADKLSDTGMPSASYAAIK